MSATALIGAQWGDEGKGKTIDILAAKADMVVRAQGGSNAGHTVVYGDSTYKLRLIPSGILYPETGEYTLSILKAETPDGARCRRNFYNYEPEAGTAHLIHTYEHDGSPLPSFCGEPVRIALNAPDAETLAEEIWTSLDENNRVSLFVRFIGCADGAEDTFIINRHTR